MIWLIVFFFLYSGWYVTGRVLNFLVRVGKIPQISTVYFFSVISMAVVWGLLIGRLWYALANYDATRGFSIFPYIKEGNTTQWLSRYPWFLLNFKDGIAWVVAKGVFVVLVGYKLVLRFLGILVRNKGYFEFALLIVWFLLLSFWLFNI